MRSATHTAASRGFTKRITFLLTRAEISCTNDSIRFRAKIVRLTNPRLTSRQVSDRFAPDVERQFREGRIAGFSAINRNTFWSIAILLLLFAPWDAYVDPAHWQSAFKVRLIGAAVIVATGLIQQLPAMGHWLPLMAKLRLVISLVAATVAASTLDRGYGFAVAGVVS